MKSFLSKGISIFMAFAVSVSAMPGDSYEHLTRLPTGQQIR